jgi:protoporphyrinogen oxidase
MTKGLAPSFLEAGEGLRFVSVCVFNVGLRRPGAAGRHWIYYPSRSFPFHRVGFAHNIDPSGTPKGSQSLYVEVSHRPDAPGSCRGMWEEVRQGLVRAGLMEPGEKPEVLDVIHIPYAYVLYDRHRERVLPSLLQELERRGAFSIGRYGAWEYSTMEDALAQGRAAAGRLNRRP